MTQQPFDPMDKLLREALESDVQPPAGLTDRIMAQVERTPQERPVSRKKDPYRKWLVSAVACLALAAVALPLALNSHQNAADTTESNDTAAQDYMVSAAPDGSAAPQDPVTTDTDGSQRNEHASAKKDDDGFTTVPNGIQADLNDQPYDPLDAALDKAAEALEHQGYTLEVLARTDAEVQVTATDGSGHSPDDPAILENAMTAAGFVLSDGWYTIPQEAAQ